MGLRTLDLSCAMEIALELRASKTAQYNLGAWRNHFRSGREICPVEAMALLQRHHPERFGNGAEVLKPLFRRANGGPILSSQVKIMLANAAEECGMPPDRMGSHSLRIGGASALLHAGIQIENIMRWGRWLSNSFQRYLWEANETAQGVSRKMSDDTTTLAVTRMGR